MAPVDRAKPGPGQESVWDYPRPPRCETTRRHVVVVLGGVTIADSRRTVRVLETGHPPVYYIPRADVAMQHLEPSPRRSFCEWKGKAHYYTVRAGGKAAADAAYSYAEPEPGFERLMDYIAFYASAMDACTVDGKKARPQPGKFYGGWITPDVVGPFKSMAGPEAR